jgi:glycosyltransferase involved in cell wall biosynthesis
MIKVCHISSAHKYNDIRIFHKECTSLANAGFDVTYIVPDSEDRVINKVKIAGVNGADNSRFVRMTKTALEVYKKAKKTDSDIYHFHDPELMPYGLLLRWSGKKVIYDVHENLSYDILDKPWIKSKLLRKVISKIMALVEKTFAAFYNRIIAVTPEIASEFTMSKTHVIRNLPIVGWIDSVAEADKKSENKIIVYSGGLTRIRGIKEMVQAMEHVNNAELWLMGLWENEIYEQECMNLNSYKNVRYLGSKSQEEVYAINKTANIGIINFYPVSNHLQSLPNKSFEYMACGLAMVLSDFEYWKKYFNNFALFANPLDPRSIADAINTLLSDDELRRTLSEKGRQEIYNNYSWENESKKLVEIYNQLAKEL